jgi:putative transposase
MAAAWLTTHPKHTREHERQMRRLKSISQAQRFFAVHGQVQNLFRVGRHHLSSVHHRLLGDRAFAGWAEATCAC